jgi:hypothetical protein
MSDTSTDVSSVTSFGDISVCEEIGQLIERCQEFHNHIHNSFETLKNIHSLVDNHNNIIVTHNEWTGDFYELLENLNTEALEGIKTTGQNNFTQKLLQVLDTCKFH